MAIDNECLEILSGENLLSKDTASRVGSFFKFFKVRKHLKECGISKFNGYAAFLIFACIFVVVFLGGNIYRIYVEVRKKIIQKDAIYGFLKQPRFNWELFVRKEGYELYNFVDQLTSEKKLKIFALDDSPLEKNSSKEIELTSSLFNHVTNTFYKGYKLLLLTWYDGETTIPIDSRLMSSAKEKGRIPIKKEKLELDPRSNGAKRRAEAIQTKFQVGYRMLEDAIKMGFRATAVVFDSWFAKPSYIIKCSKFLPVVCRVAISSKLQYWFHGSKIWVKEIYRKLNIKATKNIPVSAIVDIEDPECNKIKAKLVFIKHKVTGDLIVLLSTNTKLSNETIIRLYSMRWSIEVLFRDCKQFFKLENGYQGTDYDGQTAHIAIVMVRYMFLAYEKRKSIDDRTIGSLFYCCCKEIEELQFEEALNIIFANIIDIIEESEDKLTITRKLHQYKDFMMDKYYKMYRDYAFYKLFGIELDDALQKCS